ncbi:MAG: aminodeoxychorismate synthase component I, partial [Acidimicrobiales bacterium]
MSGSYPEERSPLEDPAELVPFARFDDLITGHGVVFADPAPELQILVADQPGDVVPVLRAVEEATAGGCWAAGFVSYEAATALDGNLATRGAAPGEPLGELPLAWFGLFEAPRTVATLSPGAEAAWAYSGTPWQPGWDVAGYGRTIDAIRARIAAGDSYQCNFTVRLHARVHGELLGLYRDLAMAQHGAYNAYLDTGRFVVACASPELFFEWSRDRLTTRPMKGTAARGRWPAEDAAQAETLACSAKDRAENVMIVDLLRNDLGKVATWGSVHVPALFELERYETLWQLTSTVTARPRPGTTLVELFRALFPCGSVTGAPKRSTMAIIAELEGSRRGVYCGAIGIVAPPGAAFRARFNVAIRTAVVDRTTGDAVYGTGGGITWDSTADAEHEELMTKTAILRPHFEEFALVETMGFRPGEGVRNLERHLARMADSASHFGFLFELGRIRRTLRAALRNVRVPCRVRLEVDRSGSASVQLGPLPPSSPRPVLLAVDLDPVDSTDVLLFHKTTRRSIYEARASRHPEADDVVLVNERNELTETTIANLAVQLGRKWWTPPI